jgi:conjugative transposon TraK protein
MPEIYKSLDDLFRQVRRLSIGSMILSAIVSTVAIREGYSYATRSGGRIYLLLDGKVLEAVAGDRGENVPVEARDHLQTFHRWFFNLDPDDKQIRASIGKALYLADGSAKALYDDEVEKGYIAGLISGNISQRVHLDSIWLDMDSKPYAFRCVGRDTLTRSTSVTTRTLVTRGYLRPVERSDNNPHGFLIENLEVVENNDGITKPK